MRIALWIVVALCALVWTAGAALAAGVIDWAAGLITSGQAAALGTAAAQAPVPAWVALWIEPDLVRAAQDAVLWAIARFQDALPWIGSAVGWLVPLTWIVWGVGLALLLAVSAGAHVLLGRLRRAAPQLRPA